MSGTETLISRVIVARSEPAGPDPGERPSPHTPGTGDRRSGAAGAQSTPAPVQRGTEDPPVRKLARRNMFPGQTVPVTIRRFTVLDVLGQGGMGVVYACYDDQLERKVAVKVLLGKRLKNTETARARLLREAQAMARLSHPNIVTVLEVGTVDDQLYVARECVRGVTPDGWGG